MMFKIVRNKNRTVKATNYDTATLTVALVNIRARTDNHSSNKHKRSGYGSDSQWEDQPSGTGTSQGNTPAGRTTSLPTTEINSKGTRPEY